MPRKKNSDVDVIDGIAELDDGEQFVEETTRKVRREKTSHRKTDEIEIEDRIETVVDPVNEICEPENRNYSPTSIAAIVFKDDDEGDVSNQYCTINIRRNPDSLNDKFATPCSSLTHLPRLLNVSLADDRADIEDRVRREFGGGHYFFQIHYNGSLSTSWRTTLSDLPAHAAPWARDEQPPPAQPGPAAPTVNPIDAFLDSVEKQNRLAALLFGDERRRLESEIAELKIANANAAAVPIEPKSEKLTILETALSVPNPALQDRILNNLFPADEPDSRHWFADLVSVAMENREAIASVAATLFGSLAPPPQKQPTVAEMLRMQPPTLPPAASEQPAKTNFRRRQPHAFADSDDQSPVGTDESVDSVDGGIAE